MRQLHPHTVTLHTSPSTETENLQVAGNHIVPPKIINHDREGCINPKSGIQYNEWGADSCGSHLGHSEVPLCISIFGYHPGFQERSQGWAQGGEAS